MDLLATVRKEGSRGGRGDFKWSDVQASSHREHYLGHSLMAPVGRWQKGRDLNWYAQEASADDVEDAAGKEARERQEEIRKIKEAEQDALARALGLPVEPRNNPNEVPLGNKEKFGEALKPTTEENDNEGGRGIGYGKYSNAMSQSGHGAIERLEGNAQPPNTELEYAVREYKRRHGDRRHRSRSRSVERETKHRRHHSRERDRYHRRRSRSRDEKSRRRSRSRSHSPHHHKGERRHRSRSPRRRDDGSRRRDREYGRAR